MNTGWLLLLESALNGTKTISMTSWRNNYDVPDPAPTCKAYKQRSEEITCVGLLTKKICYVNAIKLTKTFKTESKSIVTVQIDRTGFIGFLIR